MSIVKTTPSAASAIAPQEPICPIRHADGNAADRFDMLMNAQPADQPEKTFKFLPLLTGQGTSYEDFMPREY